MKNLYKFLRLGAVVMMVMALANCVTDSGYDLPKPVASQASDIPTDARAVASVIVERLRGQTSSNVKGVMLPDTLGRGLAENDFNYGGFGVSAHKLLRYNQRPGKADGRIIAGRLEFADAIGRRTEVLYYADYVIEGGQVHVKDVKVATLFSTFPEAVMFIVPTSKVISAGGLPKTHSGILNFVSSNAVDWTTPGQVPKKVEDYIIFTFLMDRVSPTADSLLKISKEDITEFGYKDSSKYIDINGWRIGLLPGKFNLASSDWFIKVTFTPGEEMGFGSRFIRLVGVFPLDLNRARKMAGRAGS
jgi:hypothetical protein